MIPLLLKIAKTGIVSEPPPEADDELRTRAPEIQAEILRLAYEDTVTGLPNRGMFSAKLAEAVEAYRRDGTPVAVLLMDLDRFKLINDSLGHAMGNLVLKTSCSPPGQLLAGMG